MKNKTKESQELIQKINFSMIIYLNKGLKKILKLSIYFYKSNLSK